MHTSQTQHIAIAQLTETIRNLQQQLAEVSQRLEFVEGIAKVPSSSEDTYTEGHPVFLGRQYQKSDLELERSESDRDGHFLGNSYTVANTKVEMKNDGTKRRFLGREFDGQALK